MTQTLPLSSQGDINAEVDELQRAASATTAQPQLHFRPYRSSLLRAPTKDLVQVDLEGAELLAPVFGHGEDAPLKADLTIGTGSGTPIGATDVARTRPRQRREPRRPGGARPDFHREPPVTVASGLNREALARLIATDIPDGSYVNLGIGQPTKVADHLSADCGVVLHPENGMLGMGPQPSLGAEDPDLVNAGKQPVTALPGAAYFHHADSFAMMRGGHIDVCVLGAYQVSVDGDLANWHTGRPSDVPAVGGAMDLAVGARQTWVMMDLLTRDGAPKFVPACTYPLTEPRCVSRVYTDVAVFELDGGQVVVRQTFGPSVDDLASLLAMSLVDRSQRR